MPIRSIAQLKAWFRRGKYPTEEQFADWLDSYVHKEESKIPIAQVEELPEQLNGKYAATAGQELERQHRELKSDYDAHKQSSAEQFDNIAENIEELEATDERQQEEIDALEAEVENIHTMVSLLVRDCGIAFLYEAAVEQEIRQGLLKEIRLEDFSMDHEFLFCGTRAAFFPAS